MYRRKGSSPVHVFCGWVGGQKVLRSFLINYIFRRSFAPCKKKLLIGAGYLIWPIPFKRYLSLDKPVILRNNIDIWLGRFDSTHLCALNDMHMVSINMESTVNLFIRYVVHCVLHTRVMMVHKWRNWFTNV